MSLFLIQIAIGSFVYLFANAGLLSKNKEGITHLDQAYAFIAKTLLPINRYLFDWLTLVVTPTGLAIGSGILVPLMLGTK